jgi:hypothetical protein
MSGETQSRIRQRRGLEFGVACSGELFVKRWSLRAGPRRPTSLTQYHTPRLHACQGWGRRKPNRSSTSWRTVSRWSTWSGVLAAVSWMQKPASLRGTTGYGARVT